MISTQVTLSLDIGGMDSHDRDALFLIRFPRRSIFLAADQVRLGTRFHVKAFRVGMQFDRPASRGDQVLDQGERGFQSGSL